MSALVEVHDLHKQYDPPHGVTAVAGVTFDIRRGEIFSLLGPNGAGKTTTISMLSCLLAPTGGDAAIDGHTITNESMKVRQLIGVVPQEIALYEELTARQNLSFWGQMYNLSGKALKERIDQVLEQVNLSDRADERVGAFSGGMKRRINIAAGLLHRPKLLFMDEPTVGIDPQSRRRILDMVKELQVQEGMTVLYTTHYMEEAEELSDRVGIIDHGELIAIGTQPELTKMVGSQETLKLHLAEGQHLADTTLFDDVSGVLNTTALNGEVALSVTEAGEALAGVVQRADAHGLHIRSIDIKEPNLEAVFLHLTGRALRD